MKHPIRVAEVEEALYGAGAKPVHVEAFWRSFFKPLKKKTDLPRAAALVADEARRELEAALSLHEEVRQDAESARVVGRLFDGQLIETVLLPREGVCVSSQVGCAVGCKFCMTGTFGLIRQLSDWEIIAQVLCALKIQPVHKVVFMGMGEPSHNLKNVLSAIDFLAKYGQISHKNLVLSTVGDRRLFEEIMTRPVKPALAVSLHSVFDEKRRALLPKAADIPVEELFDVMRRYAEAGKYPVQIQWTLIEGVNDGEDETERLISLWKGLKAVLNMIPVNDVPGSPFKRPSDAAMQAIAGRLKAGHILLKYRDSAAQDVEGGCGQLRARVAAEEGLRQKDSQ
jgi:23S rRNA (adenine2503-C2)-methyltransferase